MSAEANTTTEKNNSNVNSPQKPIKRKWFADAFVIVFCVSGAVFSLNMFRLDLFQSIASQNKKPMGAVTVKYNNVQRRFSDRVLWSRLTVKSPVYLGDLIRVAEYSAATLNINDGIIDINENSLIRIRASQDGEGGVVIDLGSGSLSITGSDSADSNIALNVMGRIIAPAAGATMSASAGEKGMTLKVNEGSIIIKEKDGQSRSMSAGEALILDTEGVEKAEPAAVVTLPRPNARFIKNSVEPLNIRFAWNALNIEQKTPLRLEIASGPNFTRIVRTVEGIDSSNVSLGAGIWYWRLSYQNTVLSSGQFTIVDAAISAPASPIQDSLFRYRESSPSVRFEWQPVEEASYYILEAGLTPEIINPTITKQTAVSSLVETNMEAGTWYWRVKPVFSSLYEGSTVFSQVSSFRIEKIEEPVVVAQTADNQPEIQEQPEPEQISEVIPEPAKPVTPSASSTKATDSSKPVTPSASSTKTTDSPKPVTPSASNTTTPADSISTHEFAVISQAVKWDPRIDGSSKVNYIIARETINGIEREVLTVDINLGSGNSKWAGVLTKDTNVLQRLKNASGVRFKAVGDGKKWQIAIATTDNVNDGIHRFIFSTKNGEVSSFDIPFSKLTQPEYKQYARKFNKNNIMYLGIEKDDYTTKGDAGAAKIKVFDFEIY